jgi:hypothetical protein
VVHQQTDLNSSDKLWSGQAYLGRSSRRAHRIFQGALHFRVALHRNYTALQILDHGYVLAAIQKRTIREDFNLHISWYRDRLGTWRGQSPLEKNTEIYPLRFYLLIELFQLDIGDMLAVQAPKRVLGQDNQRSL